MLLFPFVATFLFLSATFIWNISLNALSSQHEEVAVFVVLLSACAAFGVGLLVYTLTRKNPKE